MVIVLWLVGVVLVDFVDGLVVCVLRVIFVEGKELDSLVDFIFFGLVLGVIFYMFLVLSEFWEFVGVLFGGIYWFVFLVFIFIVVFVLCLVCFNLDER